MLVSNIMSCSVTRQKNPQPSSCDLTSASFADDWKSNERETGSCLWHPVGMPPGFTKQTGNGRVRLSLVRPSSSRTPYPAPWHMCVPLICGWGVGATHHPEKGVCAHTHAWACAGKIRHMCRQCRASGVRRRQPGLFQVHVQVQGHVHTEESRWALLNARSCPYYLTPLFWWCVETFFFLLIGGLAWCDEYWCWGNSES